ncbi:hypothetical protein N7497_001111 [Penicillium chrysogenum]|nr:hypothetical protein N7497_001111 [Penicillium chrysogenum]
MIREAPLSSSLVGQDDLIESTHSRHQYTPTSNDARAMRIAELMNDYRTLQLHIMEQTSSLPLSGALLEGHLVLIQSRAAALNLLRTSYKPSAAAGNRGNDDTQTSQLRRIILDASAHRHEAYKIYLRVATAKRWEINRVNLARRSEQCEVTAQQQVIDGMLQSELCNVSDQYVASELLAADKKAGYWLNEDPTLESIISWVRSGMSEQS